MEERKHYPWLIALIIVGVGINLLGAKFATLCGLWLYLDSIGTILAAATGGLLPGITVGFLSNFINGLSDPITLYYGLISVIIACVTVLLCRHGMLKNILRTLGSAFVFAVIGGGAGSVLTWMLYGLSVGEGISSKMTHYLIDNAGFSGFVAQLSSDMVLDIADKLISVIIVFIVIRILPKKLLSILPYGNQCLVGFEKRRRINGRLIHSLKDKVVLLIVITTAILSVLSVTISSLIYFDEISERYITTGENVTSLMLNEISGDMIDSYLALGESAPGYLETKGALERIRTSVPDIKYVYVYQIREDGCHVVFDLDTEDTPAAETGSVQPIDEAFTNILPDLLAGKEIEPVIANGSFGWLLTVYRPILNSAGECTAYAATDIAMADVIASRYTFVIRMISLLFGASMVIIAIAIVFAQKRIVNPIDRLAGATERFAFDSESKRRLNIEEIKTLGLNTGDEIENLYRAITKTVTDLSDYIGRLDEKNRYIAQLQDNIIQSFAGMVENRDDNTGAHIKRTAAYVQAIGSELIREKKYPDILNGEKLSEYIKAAPLHDIGKIKIPDAILNKPGRLTYDEFEIIKTHTTAGSEILRGTMTGIEDSGYLDCATDMARSHHEHWDGSGYPDSLTGENIPLGARIMAVADVFDALTSRRSYKEAYPFDKAVAMISEESGSHFDPAIVEAFISIAPTLKDIINM